MIELPEPRKDGKCCRCGNRFVVTRDGRFCKPCLSAVVREISPGSTRHCGWNRTSDHKAEKDWGEPSPWESNNLRILEGD